MYHLKLRNKNCIDPILDMNYFNKTIANIPHTNFLCLLTDDAVTWDNHIIKLIYRLNSACYAITTVKTMLSRRAFRMLYFSFIHYVISYGIFFMGNIPSCIKYS